jgi:F0F1-type ATP synthase epsilon subunit
MKLGVYSLKKIWYQGEARSITCQTLAGEITILDHHRPLISVLASGTITIVDRQKKEHFIPIKSGFVEVQQNNESRFIID